MIRRRRFGYSISERDVAKFVQDNACVQDFLNRYEAEGTTFGEKAVGLARFFRWLQVVMDLEIAPSAFLDDHLRKRSLNSVEERRWALKLALEHIRDNP